MVTNRFMYKCLSVNTHLSVLVTLLYFAEKDNIYLTEIKTEHSTNFFLIMVNENLLYLNI